MLCQTRIFLGDEYPVMGYLTEQRQMRHEAYTLTARLVLGISQKDSLNKLWLGGVAVFFLGQPSYIAIFAGVVNFLPHPNPPLTKGRE